MKPWLRLGLSVFTLVLAAKAQAAPSSSVAVLDIEGSGIDPQLLPTLTEVLTAEIDALGAYKVIAGRDVNAMVGFERTKEVAGCTDAQCLAEIGGALGVDRVVSSQIGKVGNTYVVNIKLINIRQSETEGRVYETVRGETDALINTIRTSVQRLLGAGSKAAREQGLSPKAAAATAKPTETKTPPVKVAEAPAPAPTQVAEPDEGDAEVSEPEVGEPAPVDVSSAAAPAAMGASIGWKSYVAWGVGGLALVGGVISGMKAKDLETCANDVTCVGGQQDAEDAPKAATRATILYGVGVGAIAVGFLFATVFADEPAAPATTALAPLIEADRYGLVFTTPF